MRAQIAGAVALAVIAAAGGCWVGHSHAPSKPIVPDSKGRVLYYRNPMGEPDTSPTPKKDSMGMDYIPVYEHEVPATPGAVVVDTAKVQRSGVRTEAVKQRTLEQDVTAVGAVKLNETQFAVSSPRVEGWVEKVYAGAVGIPVKAGQALADVYSPDLMQTQQEYFTAHEAESGADDASGIAALAEGALLRLRNYGLTETQIRQIKNGKEPRRLVTISAPISGIVSEKNAVLGQHFTPGDVLYRIADISKVWVVAKVFERDLASIRLGGHAAVSVKALSDRTYDGVVSFVSPTLDTETRTADVRIEVANDDGALRADMFTTVRFAITSENILAVPNSAIIDSGITQVVMIEKEAGQFEPRQVTLGRRSGDYTAVVKGVAENEKVVVNAAFLIDSESNLKAALQSLVHPAPQEPK